MSPCIPALHRSVEKIKLISGYGDGITCPDVEGVDNFKYTQVAIKNYRIRRCRACRQSGKTATKT
jgi:hypothetical protein